MEENNLPTVLIIGSANEIDEIVRTSALHRAAEHGRITALQALLKSSVDANVRN